MEEAALKRKILSKKQGRKTRARAMVHQERTVAAETAATEELETKMESIEGPRTVLGAPRQTLHGLLGNMKMNTA